MLKNGVAIDAPEALDLKIPPRSQSSYFKDRFKNAINAGNNSSKTLSAGTSASHLGPNPSVSDNLAKRNAIMA